MASRPAPSVSEIRDALVSHGRAGLEPRLSEDRAAPWDLAIDIVRAAFRTTRTKAREWLIDAVSDLNGPLAAVWVRGTVKLAARSEAGDYRRMAATPVAWPLEDQMALQFTKAGQRIPFGKRNTEMQPHELDAPWVVLRIALGGMHSAILNERAEKSREFAEREDAELTVFRSVHGDALDTITKFVERIDQSDVDHRFRDAPLIRTSTRGFGAKEFGAPGSLEITVRGKQIEALAELIREATGAA